MEIPDVLVINKADRPGADLLRAELEATMSLVPAGPWEPPIVATQSVDAVGIDELWQAVQRHRAHLAGGDRMAERQRDGMRRQLRALALDRLGRRLDAACPPDGMDALVDQVVARRIDPETAVDRLLDRLDGG